MMARKLSRITRCALYFSFLTAVGITVAVRAEEQIDAASATSDFENPFAVPAGQQQSAAQQTLAPPPDAQDPQPLRRAATVYRNPFAPTSAAPPLETPLLPGPISRWRRSVMPLDEPAPIKSAILSAEPIEDIHIPWDQLPPIEKLRDRGASRSTITDIATDVAFPHPPDVVQFGPAPLNQPAWLSVGPRTERALPPVTQAAAIEPIPGMRPFAPVDAAPTQPIAADSISIAIADNGQAPQDWLAQAQDAARQCRTADDLLSVASLCQRGLSSNPSAELSGALRRLGAWAHNRRGELLADEGQQEQALAEFQKAIMLDAECSLALHNRAVTFAQQNEHEAALRDFNRVIELNPGLAMALRNRGELLASLGRMSEAVPDYDRALAATPDDAELHVARAYARQRLGDMEGAKVDLNRAVQLAPKDADALTARGNLSALCGDYERALADFRRAITLDGQCAEAYRSLAWLHATCSNERYRNPQQALAAAQTAEKLSPGDYLVLEALAAAYAAADEFDRAVRIQQQAIEAAPAGFTKPLRQRLTSYQHGKAYRSGSPSSSILPASHESRTARPSPESRQR